MSDHGRGDQRRRSLDFVERSTLSSVIPSSNTLNIEEVLRGQVERLGSADGLLASAIAQRQSVFFDETIDVYIVLQTPYFDETALRSYVSRLNIFLEAQVLNTHPDTFDGPANGEVIYSGSVAEGVDPLIIVQAPNGSSSTTDESHILVLWKLPVELNRPARLRLQNPALVLSASANLKSAEHVQHGAMRDEYLLSQVPSGFNLLEPFSNDPAFGTSKPRLSALRVSRVIPATQGSKDLFRPVRKIAHQPVKMVSPFGIRARYSRPQHRATSPSIIASVDVDITPSAGLEVTLEAVTLRATDLTVEDLNKIEGMALPLTYRPRDDVTFLYRLRPEETDTGKSNIKPVHISINATIKVSETCLPRIFMRWTTNVDLTLPMSPGYGPANPSLIRRDHRPSQLSIGSTYDTPPTVASVATSRPDSLPSIELLTRHQRPASLQDFGVTISFTSTSTDVIKRGALFTWQVFIVNRSDRPRKLALVAIPKRRRTEHMNINRAPSTPSFAHKDPNVADAVLDENILHAMHRNSTVEAAEIICYSTDTRVGPLAPSTCHTVELRFMALKSGVLGLEAVRVIDLANQEHVDIKDLPSIVVSAA